MLLNLQISPESKAGTGNDQVSIIITHTSM